MPLGLRYDFQSNLAIYIARRPVRQDMNLVHLVKTMMFRITLRKSLLLTLLDFCETFGANTRKVVSGMDGVDAAIASAKAKYLLTESENPARLTPECRGVRPISRRCH